ncbi:MAG TPA: leucyl/phenylalanyl-tRNA--protein transferase [Rhodobacteraceae bacterium]|nr:leucyl/phenylalanyl-tRNA--protein transferase [Paracoccaceae bacterium]
MQAGRITPELLLRAYAAGVFPMSEAQDDPRVFWVDPERRGILPLDGFHLSRSLRKTILKTRFHVTLDMAFDEVVRGCAAREETWINDNIFRGYFALHRLGYAHSVEVWERDDLVGGVYGVALGRAFFGESMFSRATDASKIALATLIAHLRQTGFELFDTQFTTEHLVSLGAVEVPRAEYHRMLDAALESGVAEILSRPLPTGDAVVAQLKDGPGV